MVGGRLLSAISFRFMIAAICVSSLFSNSYANGGNETDRQALLEFKSKITNDPLGVLSSWNNSIHFCHWNGVTCSSKHQRVTKLTLYSIELAGTISPYVGNLSFLKVLSLANNSFKDGIPPEIGRLRRLEVLYLLKNSLSGGIPSNISQCSNLVRLWLDHNKLVGQIPLEFAWLKLLKLFSVHTNNLTGNIPPFFGNMSSLDQLFFSINNMVGSIPDSLGQLRVITGLGLAMNHFSGDVPLSIFNLTSVKELDLGYNYKLQGDLPPELFIPLPNITFFSVISNQFTGSIPTSLSNASKLVKIQLEENKFTGKVPNLQRLKSIQLLFFGLNNLGTGGLDDLNFLCSLGNTSTLEQLDISDNNFGAAIPECIGKLSSNFWLLWLANNHIKGSIPKAIGSLPSLADFWASNNILSGTIPQIIGNLQRLSVLRLDKNKFSGQIPSSLGNLNILSRLNLSDNQLHGAIPSSLGDCKNLQALDLSRNILNGTIPVQVLSLSSLSIYLGLSKNYLTGSIPNEISKLVNLDKLDIGDNMLSGEIPGDIGSCTSLEFLNMQGNLLQGSIPSSLRLLRGLQELDLSRNNLSGQIPEFLAEFRFLTNLNLSFNQLEGKVPTEGVFKNITATSVIGNKNLCGGIPEFQLPVCNLQKSNRRLSGKLKAIISSVAGILGVILVLSFILLLRSRKRMGKPISFNDRGLIPKVSYRDLHKATDGFCQENLLGVGSFGTVYKGVIKEGGLPIAVKVIDLKHHGASKSFLTECKALRNIRHRNLVRILTACSSIDYKGNDFKALVYEYVENGSLEEWLHPSHLEPKNLPLAKRLKIAIDVAFALEYLHEQCEPAVVHCDLKPSNILLDDEMTAHISDFGIAKMLSKGIQIHSTEQSSSIGLRGTIGYAPPEYGLGGEISTSGDVYSYGIILLEMFTGKKPTNDMFREGLNLHKLAEKSLPDRVVEIGDPNLLEEIGQMDPSTTTECLTSLVEIGVACSAELPRERTTINEVAIKLRYIHDKLLGQGR